MNEFNATPYAVKQRFFVVSKFAPQNICRRSHAFTLVELLVVIGIIALLIGLLLPALTKILSKSRDLLCSSNLRQIGVALNCYVYDYKGYLPAAELPVTTTSTVPWQLSIWKYIFHQPPPVSSVSTTDTYTFLVGTIFTCPKGVYDPHPAFGQSSTYLSLGYDMNVDLPGEIITVRGPSTLDSRHMGAPRRLDHVRYASNTLLVSDGVDGWVSIDSCGSRSAITGPSYSEYDEVAHPLHQNRHPKGNIFCLMCDGSAGSREWIYDTTQIPILPVSFSGGTYPAYPSNVQQFWFGHVPDQNGD